MLPGGGRYRPDPVPPYPSPGERLPHRFDHFPSRRESEPWRRSPSHRLQLQDGPSQGYAHPVPPPSLPPTPRPGDTPKRGRLQVTVLRAVGLRKSNNFVRLRFPEKLGRNPSGATFYTQAETRPVFGTPSPEWNDSFLLNPICHPDGRDFLCHMPLEAEVVEEGTGLIHGRDAISLSDLARGVDYYRSIECDEGQFFLELQALDFGRSGMEVTVIGCSGVWEEAGDVSVLLRHYGQVKRTMALPGPDPVWRETFHFAADTRRVGAEVLGRDTIAVEALLTERRGPEQSLGIGHFDLEPLECGRTRRKNVPVGDGYVTLEVTPLDFGHGKDMPQSLLPGTDPPRSGFPEYRGPFHVDAPDYESKFQLQTTNSREELPPVPARPFPSYAGLDAPGGSLQRKFEPLAPDSKHGLSSPTTPKSPVSPRQLDPDIGLLHLTIVEVAGLAELMDCAVRIQLEEKRIQTTTKPATGNPHFIESFKLYVRLTKGSRAGWRIGRQATTPLRISLLDMKAGREVGTLSLSLADLYEDKGTEVQAAQLLDKDGNKVGTISLLLKASGFGMKCFRGRMQCRVVQGSELRLLDPETYVALRLRDEKFTTRPALGNNPRWDESFIFHPDVFEKRGYVVCLDQLHVVLVENNEAATAPVGAGVVDLSRIVRGQPETFMVDLGKQGTVRLEVEAENFGIVGPNQADLYQPIPEPAPPAPSSPPQAGYPMPPSAYLPQPDRPANRQKYYVPPSKRDADDQTVQALCDELRELQRERARLEQRSNEELDPLRMELNVLRAQAARASLHRERLRTPQRRHSLTDRPDGDPAEPPRRPASARRRHSDRWAEGPQHRRPAERFLDQLQTSAAAQPSRGVGFATPQPWRPLPPAYAAAAPPLSTSAGWLDASPFPPGPREGAFPTPQTLVPIPISVGFGAPRY